MGLADVSNILWRERQLLELLLFKLEEEQLVLSSGRSRWLAHATREVELVLEQVKTAELARAVEVAGLGVELGVGAEPSLRDLIAAAPEPWNNLFDQHRQAFQAAAHEIQSLADHNREMLARGHKAATEALKWLDQNLPADGFYSASGTAVAASGPRLVNESM
jgi:hypothetical protein